MTNWPGVGTEPICNTKWEHNTRFLSLWNSFKFIVQPHYKASKIKWYHTHLRSCPRQFINHHPDAFIILLLHLSNSAAILRTNGHESADPNMFLQLMWMKLNAYPRGISHINHQKDIKMATKVWRLTPYHFNLPLLSLQDMTGEIRTVQPLSKVSSPFSSDWC